MGDPAPSSALNTTLVLFEFISKSTNTPLLLLVPKESLIVFTVPPLMVTLDTLNNVSSI